MNNIYRQFLLGPSLWRIMGLSRPVIIFYAQIPHPYLLFFLLWPGLPCQIHPSPLKRSMSLIPTSPQAPGEWPSPEELGARAAFTTPDHAPLSPQSSVASSGSEQTEEQGSSRNTFQEDGSGMKGASGGQCQKPFFRAWAGLQGQKLACSCPLREGTGLKAIDNPCPHSSERQIIDS